MVVLLDVPGRVAPTVMPLAEEDEESGIAESICDASRFIAVVDVDGPNDAPPGEPESAGWSCELGRPSPPLPCDRKVAGSSNGSLLPLELRGGLTGP